MAISSVTISLRLIRPSFSANGLKNTLATMAPYSVVINATAIPAPMPDGSDMSCNIMINPIRVPIIP